MGIFFSLKNNLRSNGKIVFFLLTTYPYILLPQTTPNKSFFLHFKQPKTPLNPLDNEQVMQKLIIMLFKSFLNDRTL